MRAEPRHSSTNESGEHCLAPHQREPVAVHDGVDGLEGEVGHLHRPGHPPALRPEPVKETLVS